MGQAGEPKAVALRAGWRCPQAKVCCAEIFETSKRRQVRTIKKCLIFQRWQLIFKINLNELWLFATSGIDHQCESNLEYSVLAAVVREGSSKEVSKAGTHRHQEADKHM